MSSVKNVIKDNYNMMQLKEYLRAAIKDAGFSHAEISKTPMGAKVALHVTKPGLVIGRKGLGIRELTEKLGTDFGLKNPQITVNEIAKPELSPSVMCNRIASHIERGTAFRRATMWTLKQIMDSGAMGVQITISGKLRGDRSAFEKHTAGILPRAGHHAEVIVDEDIAHVKTPMGLIGIRIRIARKEKFVPEFELKSKSAQAQEKQKSKKKAQDAKAEDETNAEATSDGTAQDAKPDGGAAPGADATPDGDAASDVRPKDGTAPDAAEPEKDAPAPDDGGAVAKTDTEQIEMATEKMAEMDTVEDAEGQIK